MPYKNLLKKHSVNGVTEDSLKKGISTIAKNLTQIVDAGVMIAIADLLAYGDIQEVQSNEQ